MTSLTFGALISILLSLIAYLVIGRSDYYQTKNLKQYFFYDWTLSSRYVSETIFASGMSLSTVVIALLQLGLIFGIGLSWATLSYCLGWGILIFASPLIKQSTHKSDTLHTFIGATYGSPLLTKVASTTTIIGFVGTYSVELFAAYIIFSAIGIEGTYNTIGVLCFAIVTLTYSSLGGFRSIIRSDRIQTFLLIPSVLILFLLALNYWRASGSISLSASPLLFSYTLPFSVALSLFLINVAFPLVDMSAWQRVIAATSSKEFKKGATVSIIGFAITWTILILISIIISLSLQDGRDPFIEIVQSINNNNKFSSFIVGLLLFPGLIAAMLSTADTFLNAAGHTLSLDILNVNVADVDSNTSTKIRRHVFILGLIGFVVTVLLRSIGFDIVDMIFSVYGGTLALFAPVLFALYFRDQFPNVDLSKPALISIIVGISLAWVNGIYSVMPAEYVSSLPASITTIFPQDVYKSPIYAFVASVSIFTLFSTPILLNKSKSIIA